MLMFSVRTWNDASLQPRSTCVTIPGFASPSTISSRHSSSRSPWSVHYSSQSPCPLSPRPERNSHPQAQTRHPARFLLSSIILLNGDPKDGGLLIPAYHVVDGNYANGLSEVCSNFVSSQDRVAGGSSRSSAALHGTGFPTSAPLVQDHRLQPAGSMVLV